MTRTILVFPHQLFKEIFFMEGEVLLIEDPLFFGDAKHPIPFHKQKLMLHYASMDAFEARLKNDGRTVRRICYEDGSVPDYFKGVSPSGEVVYFDLVDDVLRRRVEAQIESFGGAVKKLDTPNFITTLEEIHTHFKRDKDFYMHDFYIVQRNKHDVLMKAGKPEGGKYSFDTANRKKLPKDIEIPVMEAKKPSLHVLSAKKKVNALFPDNPGVAEGFDYPITHESAEASFKFFLRRKMLHFGPYQDALSERGSVLFHSRLSAALNIGLLSPMAMVRAAERVDAPIESREGYIRQILGWREFMRASYEKLGGRMRRSNTLGHTRKMPQWFKEGKSGLHPFDTVIGRLESSAYSHHIERLMVIGNLALLLRIDPDEVYRYFMAMHIDAYDWVMVPNVYGMSQFAAGALLTTKPYFSGANYLRKMGDFKKGEWEEAWDALFYLFVRDHRTMIEKNPRLRMLIRHLDHKSEDTMDRYGRMTALYLE